MTLLSFVQRAWMLTFALVLVFASPAAAAEKCIEKPGPRAAVKAPRELDSSSAEPTLSVPLKYKSEANGDVRLGVKSGSVGKTPRAVSAEIIKKPTRNGDERLDGTVRVAAEPVSGGRAVLASACVSGASTFQAGKYEGTIEIHGTRVREFSYAIVVTKKWPYIIPLIILGLMFVSVVVAEVAEVGRKTKKTGTPGNLIVIVFASVLLTGTYFGTYAANATWGDDPAKQLAGLIAAAIASVATARASATKLAGG